MNQSTITLVAACLSPALTLVGAATMEAIRSHRKKLVWSVTPTTVMVVPTGEEKKHYETGVLLLRNRSRQPLANVVVAHNIYNSWYRVEPAIEMTRIPLENEAEGFKFALFPAKSTITITYLFFERPPGNILSRIYSDDGDATHVSFVFQRQAPQWQRVSQYILALFGACTLIYWLLRASLAIYSLSRLIPK